MLVLHRAPEPFDKDVVHPSPLAIHADLDLVGLQDAGELLTSELGGFNRSSQHRQPGGVYGKTSGMDEAVNREGRVALSWGSFASARDRKEVLGTDCNRNHQREGSGGRWCIPGCGLTLVPASWRYAIVHVKTHFRKMSVICGARRDRASSSPRRRRPGDCPPNWPKPFDCLTGVNTQCCDSWWWIQPLGDRT